MYTDGNKVEYSRAGSGVLIRGPNKIMKRIPDFSSVFKREFIAIDEGLSCILSFLDPQVIWIMTDSRNAIQHLSN
ncbi:hypothetical protein X975_25474, partial [Stegodyphus mimosarum]